MIARLALPLFLATVAATATADPLITGAEFAAHATGRTLSFATPKGEPAGTEHYLPGKRVLWHAHGADICKTGKWYQHRFDQGPAICFAYDDTPLPVCWYMTLTDDRLTVRQVTSPTDVLTEVPGPAKMPCTSPHLGS